MLSFGVTVTRAAIGPLQMHVVQIILWLWPFDPFHGSSEIRFSFVPLNPQTCAGSVYHLAS